MGGRARQAIANMSVVIRNGVLNDLQMVTELQNATFATGWSLDSIKDYLSPTSDIAKFTVVADDAGQVAGFVMVHKVVDEAQIYNLVVAAPYRKQGIGGQLLDKVLERLRGTDTHKVSLEVRESNTPARALYDARGFREVFRRPGYYRRPSEDALIFELIFAAK